MSETEIRRYRFGPLERRGLIGSLRATQVIPMAVSLAAAVVLMRTLPSGAGLFAALGLVLAVAAFCFWPLNGRSAEEWLPIAAAHAWRRLSGRHRRLSVAPAAGVRANDTGRPEPVVALPDAAQGLELLAAPFRGETVGVVKDARAKTYTAILAVRVTSFGLLDRSEQETRQAGWGGVSRVSRAKARRSAASSGSSARSPRTATRSAATSARHGIEKPRPSTRSRCGHTSTSSAQRRL